MDFRRNAELNISRKLLWRRLALLCVSFEQKVNRPLEIQFCLLYGFSLEENCVTNSDDYSTNQILFSNKLNPCGISFVSEC